MVGGDLLEHRLHFIIAVESSCRGLGIAEDLQSGKMSTTEAKEC